MTYGDYEKLCRENGIEPFADDDANEPVNCESLDVTARCKLRALCSALNEQSHTLPHRRDRDFLRAKVAQMRLAMDRPHLAGFAKEILARGRNIPGELSNFLQNLSTHAS